MGQDTINPGSVQRAGQGLRAPLIREASFQDYDQIAAVHVRNGLAVRSRRDWLDLWEGNPAYARSQRERWPIGWVLEDGKGEVVGSIANIPREYRLRGKIVSAAAAASWVVDQPYRAYSVLLLHRLSRQPNADLLVCTTVGPTSEPGYAALRWVRVPSGRWNSARFWITGRRGFLASALRRRWAAPQALARALSYPGSLALLCREGFGPARLNGKGRQWHIERRTELDGRFDALWEALEEENEDVLLAVRDRKTIEWHRRKAVAEDRAWIVTASKGSRLSGFAMLQRHDNPACGLKRVRLVDTQVLKSDEDALPGILACVLEECRADGVHVVEQFGCWPDRPPLAAAPYQRTFPSWAYYYKTNDKDLGRVLADPSMWAPTCFDGDQCL